MMASVFKSAGYILFAALCVIIALYPVFYFTEGRTFGLLKSKPQVYTSNIVWNTGFYIHIIFGGIALLTGWTQFVEKWRNKKPRLHRQVGKIYVAAALLSSAAAIGIGFFSTGGFIAAFGFVSLGLFWCLATWKAYASICRKEPESHQQWMTYSYAGCFAAVMLRIWLPLLVIIIGDFIIAYQIVAWLCWVPNIVVAKFIIQSASRRQLRYNTKTTIAKM